MGKKSGLYNRIKKINLFQNVIIFYLLIQGIDEI